MMTLGSLFDGVGTWTLAARNVGIKPVWSSEIDSFACSVTRRRFPETIQLGDINQLENVPEVDIITAGSPCQDLSIAGKRSGIRGERSGLFFRAVELVRRSHARFFIWENVTGVFSSNKGRDFRAVLEEISETEIPLPERWSDAGLVDCGDCQIAWRLLDSQYFRLPQRRRRVFIVASFGSRSAAQILFERTGLQSDSQPVKASEVETARTISYGIGRDAFNQSDNAKFKPTIDVEISPPLRARGPNAVCTNVVRRLTPLECERLQGLPDNWTEGGSNSARYKAIGNGMALPIAEWILKRIKEQCEDVN